MLVGRMGKDGYSTDSIQFSARMPPEQKEEFREWCEDRGVSMTEAFLDFVEAAVDSDEQLPPWLPEDDELRAAWRILDQHVPANSRRISTEAAMTLLSSKLNVPKSTVKRGLLQPLESHDPPLIRPVWGDIHVYGDPTKATVDHSSGNDGEPDVADREEVRELIDGLLDAEAVE